MAIKDTHEFDDTREAFRRQLVDQLMMRADMFRSANEQIQTYLFSVHGGGLVAALAFLSSERGKEELSWLPLTIGLLIGGVVLSGFMRVFGYIVTMGLMIAMGDAIKRFDGRDLGQKEVLPNSLPWYLAWLGYLAIGLGGVNFVVFLSALWITFRNFLLPQL